MAYFEPGTASLKTVQPYLDHVVLAFSPDRLVWGSDWPVVQMANGIVDWIDITRKFLGQMPPKDADKIAYLNASRIYRLPY